MVLFARHRFSISILIAWFVFGVTSRALADCSLTSTGNVPLTDLTGTYRGVVGGLYPNGTSIRPSAPEATGLQLAREQVRPLDAQGQPDPVNGRIVLVSLGMSRSTSPASIPCA